MHGYFYRLFSACRIGRSATLPAAFLLSVFLGSACYRAFPAGDASQCTQLLSSQARLLPSLFCGALPLLLGALFFLAPHGQLLCLLAPGYAGFLMGYTASMFVYELGPMGWFMSLGLLLGRGLGLCVLFWFLLRRFHQGMTDFACDLILGCFVSWALLLVSDHFFLPFFLSVVRNFL